MNTARRNQQILETLRQKGQLSVDEACSMFGISPATARRAFLRLTEQGKALKTWGGLQVLESNSSSLNNSSPTQLRLQENLPAKQKIAAKAASLVKDGDIIFIDGGSTTFQLAPHLAERPVRILTNSILIAHEIDRLRNGPEGAEVFLTGGYLYPRSGLLVGPEAIDSIKRHHAMLAFLSVGGIHEEGASNNHALIVEVERMMLTNAAATYLLADSTKFQRREMILECTWDEVTAVITDTPQPQPFKTI